MLRAMGIVRCTRLTGSALGAGSGEQDELVEAGEDDREVCGECRGVGKTLETVRRSGLRSSAIVPGRGVAVTAHGL